MMKLIFAMTGSTLNDATTAHAILNIQSRPTQIHHLTRSFGNCTLGHTFMHYITPYIHALHYTIHSCIPLHHTFMHYITQYIHALHYTKNTSSCEVNAFPIASIGVRLLDKLNSSSIPLSSVIINNRQP